MYHCRMSYLNGLYIIFHNFCNEIASKCGVISDIICYVATSSERHYLKLHFWQLINLTSKCKFVLYFEHSV